MGEEEKEEEKGEKEEGRGSREMIEKDVVQIAVQTSRQSTDRSPPADKHRQVALDGLAAQCLWRRQQQNRQRQQQHLARLACQVDPATRQKGQGQGQVQVRMRPEQQNAATTGCQLTQGTR